MRRCLLAWMLLLLTVIPVSASALEAPAVPDSGEAYFPEEPETFTQGLMEILGEAVAQFKPKLLDAATVCTALLAVCILTSVLGLLPGIQEGMVNILGAAAISVLLLKQSYSLIHLGVNTVQELSEYGKLLLPVMTAALAAQGGTLTSASLYAATTVFDAVLCAAISKLIVPMIYIYLCLGIACSAIGETMLEKMRDFLKWLMTWCLKVILYIFIGYISITGVVSGSADASALKAAKLTISGMVPVVGSILSDASEAVLVGADIMKNAVGVYGSLALICVWIGPFITIGAQYLLLKVSGTVCSIFAAKRTSSLIQDFSSAMGMLLAMTGSICLLLLISTVSLMRGLGQ